MPLLNGIFVVVFIHLGQLVCSTLSVVTLEARCFPSEFRFGTTTAAFQVEGIGNVSSYDRSVWDDDCHSKSDLPCDNLTEDFVQRCIQDIQRMRDTGVSSFRFSLSWSRLMRWNDENRKMVPNPQGVAFYHALLDELLASGVQAIVTLYHLGLPPMLQTQLDPNGWFHPEIDTHFKDFASLAFHQYGHKVNYWATFHEPLTFITDAYGSRRGAFSGIEPSDTNTYTVAHNVLRSHAQAVALFRDLKHEDGSVVDVGARIGIVLNAAYGYPVDKSNAMDVAAAERKMQFDLGWFMMPLVAGDYPAIMRERVKERLPRFTAEEAALVKGSYDVLMLDDQTAEAVTDCGSERSSISCDDLPRGHTRDRGIDGMRSVNEARVASAIIPMCSWLTGHLDDSVATAKWLHTMDPKIEILLTKNVWCRDNSGINETELQFHEAYVEQVYRAVVKESIPIIGYTVWSLLNIGQKSRSESLYLNDSNNNWPDHVRISRSAANWFAHLSISKCFDPVITEHKQEPTAVEKDLYDSEADGDDKAVVPWSLSEVILLLVVGLAVLGAITCEAMRELHFSHQGSREEMQVLITVED